MNFNNKIVLNKTDIFLYIYLIIAFIFLLTFGIRAVKGEIDFEFYADSETYIEFMSEKQSYLNILLLYPNMIGPTIVLTILQESFIAVFILNIYIVLFFYFNCNKFFKINKYNLFIWIVISPMFFSSIIAINKEIISILVIALFYKYYSTKSMFTLILSILISFLVRWQMALFIITLTFLLGKFNPFKQKKFFSLLLLLLLISVVYYLNLGSFEQFNSIAELGQETSTEGSGLFNFFLNIQNTGPLGYFIVFIPKFFFLFIGVLGRYYNFFDTTDFYNNVIVFLQSVANFLILIKIIRLKIGLDNVFLFSAIVYCIIFALSPIFAPRYFFSAYILLAMAISSNSNKSIVLTKKGF